jgi:hypothetical protein
MEITTSEYIPKPTVEEMNIALAKQAEADITENKKFRVELDTVLQKLKNSTRKSRDRSLTITHLEDSIMRLGMDLKELNKDQTPASQLEIAKAAYLRYGQVTDFKNFRGDPMPNFEELNDTIKNAWIAAACPGKPYPDSYNPSNTVIQKPADGLTM